MHLQEASENDLMRGPHKSQMDESFLWEALTRLLTNEG